MGCTCSTGCARYRSEPRDGRVPTQIPISSNNPGGKDFYNQLPQTNPHAFPNASIWENVSLCDQFPVLGPRKNYQKQKQLVGKVMLMLQNNQGIIILELNK